MGTPGETRGTALVLEDDDTLALLLRGLLERAGFRVELVDTFQDAVGVVRAEDAVDLVVLPLRMRGADGFEQVGALRSSTRAAILALGARDSPRDRAVALNAGADDYLALPFDPAAFEARVAGIVPRPGPAAT